MISDIVSLLACPVCRAELTLHDRTLRCTDGHTFDLSRQGHVSLLARPGPGSGDTSEMVDARERFLATGRYDPVSAAVVDAAASVAAPRCVIDVGGGAGHHLAYLLDRSPAQQGIVIDPSTPALRRAARRHPRITAIGADVWQGLPIRDHVATTVVCVFAPRNGVEFHRVLHPDGRLVIVTPEPEHLGNLPAELRPVTVDPSKQERLQRELGGVFEQVERRTLTWSMPLTTQEVRWLVAMGPNARHVDAAAVTSVTESSDMLEITASVIVSCWLPQR